MEGMPGFSQIPEKAELEFSITPPPLTCFCFLFFCFLIHVAFLCVCVSLISSACTNLQNYQKKKKENPWSLSFQTIQIHRINRWVKKVIPSSKSNDSGVINEKTMLFLKRSGQFV